MMSDLIDYIKECNKHDIDERQIRQSLLAAGWVRDEVDQAFTIVQTQKRKELMDTLGRAMGFILLLGFIGYIILCGYFIWVGIHIFNPYSGSRH